MKLLRCRWAELTGLRVCCVSPGVCVAGNSSSRSEILELELPPRLSAAQNQVIFMHLIDLTLPRSICFRILPVVRGSALLAQHLHL